MKDLSILGDSIEDGFAFGSAIVLIHLRSMLG